MENRNYIDFTPAWMPQQSGNAFIDRLSADLGTDASGIGSFLQFTFPNLYDPNLSITGNVRKINSFLRAKKDRGENLTKIENILLQSTEYVQGQLDRTRKEEMNRTLTRNLPVIGLAAVALFLIFRK